MHQFTPFIHISLLVSVLFNEPKLLKSITQAVRIVAHTGSFSALQRAEIAEIGRDIPDGAYLVGVSVLFNEPKLLKSKFEQRIFRPHSGFSALQRAEIAEICANTASVRGLRARFSALQRAEIAEIPPSGSHTRSGGLFQCSSTSRNC